MQIMSFIKPLQKRWVALFFLLCWVVPFLAVISFSILMPVPVGDRREIAQTAADQERLVSSERKTDPDGVTTAEGEKTDRRPPAALVSRQEPTPQPTPVVTANPSGNRQPDPVDLNLLARVIHAEARGEPLEGQVAVGAVLINRVKNPNFPDDLWSVVFKKGEFCTVRDGQVWLEPNATAYRAARLAKAGWDPTNGALYFYNPSKTTSAWIWSRTVTTRIGSHVFAI